MERCSLALGLEYLGPFFLGSVCLRLIGKDGSSRIAKCRIYATQLIYEMAEMQQATPRIQRKQPAHQWWRI
jgi:hypothetical protein